MIARSGVETLTLVDPAIVTSRSLEGNTYAKECDIGKSKVEMTKEYIQKIFPHTKVEKIQEKCSRKILDSIFENELLKPDIVLDCMLELEDKAQLIKYCLDNNIEVISAGSALGKNDPSKIQIREIRNCPFDTYNKTLTKLIGKSLAKKSFKMVFTSEKVAENPKNIDKNTRMGSIFSIIGIAMAASVLYRLAGETMDCSKIDDVRIVNIEKWLKKIKNVLINQKITHLDDYDINDFYFSASKVFEWKSPLTDLKSPDLFISIWDKTKLVNGKNLVLLDKEEALKLNKSTAET